MAPSTFSSCMSMTVTPFWCARSATAALTKSNSSFTGVYDYLLTQGLQPQLHTLDNKASTILKAFVTAENVEYQLDPPHIH